MYSPLQYGSKCFQTYILVQKCSLGGTATLAVFLSHRSMAPAEKATSKNNQQYPTVAATHIGKQHTAVTLVQGNLPLKRKMFADPIKRPATDLLAFQTRVSEI